ncbi:hypothetical protein [Neisseria sp. HMSC065D04]|nr:hypothetical protein [Neisseria sp. HMSC065D04]
MSFKPTRFERHYKLKGRLKTQYGFSDDLSHTPAKPNIPKSKPDGCP